MRVVINQPNYIPWRGYFDLIRRADLFIFHDDIQYTKQDWRNRNWIKTDIGKAWLTVPVKKVAVETCICDVLINDSTPWRQMHQNKIYCYYKKAPYFNVYAPAFFALLAEPVESLSVLDIKLTRWIMDVLDIHTPVLLSSEMKLGGTKTDKLLALLSKVNASAYLSGPAAKAYIDVSSFEKAGIGLEWMSYDYLPYPQMHGPFDPYVSVLDLVFNCGAQAKSYIASQAEPVSAF